MLKSNPEIQKSLQELNSAVESMCDVVNSQENSTEKTAGIKKIMQDINNLFENEIEE